MGVTASKSHFRPRYYTPPFTYRLIRVVTAVLMRLIYRWNVVRLGEVPSVGPAIIVVNHLHLLDPFAVAPHVDRQIITLVAHKWRDSWFMRTFLDAIGVIWVRRGEVDREALRDCLEVLQNGQVLAIAPEGTRSRQGGLQQAKAGTSYLAVRSNAVIVPIVYWGIERLREWRPWRRPLVHVVIGKAFRLPRPEGRQTAEKLAQLTELIMLQMARLLPEPYRGVYAERVAAYEAGDRPAVDIIPA
ncbi:MAG: 1-acyl-sn-glycerol-3-phosphate acyltransferase [Anaerolineae bacterium]|nr:1-acyl-sn-glycerol-3-phosphate acyltransferase [Anaerolineae bacterium]